MPDEKWAFVGDFVIWNFPNAGNPQKVQRFPIEWAAALRDMAAHGPELLLPAHGLPIEGAERIGRVIGTIAGAFEHLVTEVVEMMNAGEVLDTIIHSVSPALVRRARVRHSGHLAPVRWLVGRCAEPPEALTGRGLRR